MAFPIIPIIGATIGTMIVSNIKEQQDIEKAKKHGTKLAADKYAPVLNQLENDLEELTTQRAEKLKSIKVQLKDYETKYRDLLKREEELTQLIRFAVFGLKGTMENIEGDPDYLEVEMIEEIGRPPKGKTFSELYSGKSTLLSIFYDKNSVMAATAEAYFKAKDEWEKKIKDLKQKISNIIDLLDEKEQKLLNLNYDLEMKIVALDTRVTELQRVYQEKYSKL